MKFFLDHDVPEEAACVLRHWKHETILLRDVLPITAPDAEAFAYARGHGLVTITCNRDDFLGLAAQHPDQPGLIILVRRRTRQAECAALHSLLRRAGETGLRNNINFA